MIRNHFLKLFLAVILCVMQLSSVFSAFAQDAAAVEYDAQDEVFRSSLLLKSTDGSSDVLRMLEYNLYTFHEGETSDPKMQGVPFDESMKSLLEGLSEGGVKASKDVYLESIEDGKQGIVKLVLDMVSNPVETVPVDVVFVLDRSGSMNTYYTSYQNMAAEQGGDPVWGAGDFSDYADYTQLNGSNHPCLNEKHYYQLPVSYDGSTENLIVYIYPTADTVVYFQVGGKTYTLPFYDETTDTVYGFPHVTPEYGGEWWTYIKGKIREKMEASSAEGGAGLTGVTIPAEGHSEFNNVHYNGSGELITMRESVKAYLADQSSDPATSPVNGPYDGPFYCPGIPLAADVDEDYDGCLDRSSISRALLHEFSLAMLEASEKNRVGYTAFHSQVKGGYEGINVIPLTKDEKKLSRIWTDLGGDGGTNYTDGLAQALNVLKVGQDANVTEVYDYEVNSEGKRIISKTIPITRDPQDVKPAADRKTYVILISDGIPTYETDFIKEIADEIKARPNTVVFGVGIHSGERETDDYLRDIVATDPNFFRNCKTVDELRQFIEMIKNSILYPQVEVKEVFGTVSATGVPAYELLVDEDHPIRIINREETIEITSVNDLSLYGINVVEDDNGRLTEIDWSYSAKPAGARLEAYLKMDETMLSVYTGEEGVFPTNDHASYRHQPAEDNGTDLNWSDPVELPTPAAMKVRVAELTIEKSNTPTEDEIYLLPGDSLTYSFTPKATGSEGMVFKDVVLTDTLPADVKIAGNTSVDNDQVTLNFGDITVGQEVSPLSFDVTVADGAGSIVNEAVFTSSITGVEKVAQTNQVVNHRGAIFAPSALKYVNGILTDSQLEGAFQFTISTGHTEEDGVTMPETVTVFNGTDGRIAFDAIAFRQQSPSEGFAFTITEQIGQTAPAGVGLPAEGSTAAFSIQVGKDEDGGLMVKNQADLSDISFRNTYAVPFTIEVSKVLENAQLKDGQFTFELSALTPEAPMPDVITATNDANGLIHFGPIIFSDSFLQIGEKHEYRYQITEVSPLPGGVSTQNPNAFVTVTLECMGPADVKITQSGDEQITNTYKAEGQMELTLTKMIRNRFFHSGDAFTFHIKPMDDSPLPLLNGAPVSTVTIYPMTGAETPVAFGSFQFTLADAGKTYVYEIYEEKGNDRDIDYDLNVRRLSLTIADNGDGTLLITPVWYDGSSTFVNIHIPPKDISVYKIWRNTADVANEGDVTVVLYCEEDPTFRMERSFGADENWQTVFTNLDGRYNYNVTEINVPSGFVFEIRDNGTSYTIINTRIPPSGDASHLILWTVLAAASLTGMLLLMKRREHI